MTYSEEAIARLQATKGFVFDLDGTLALGDARHQGVDALPGAVEFLAHLDKVDLPFVVFTNGTLRPPVQLVGMLRAAGFTLPDDAVQTPASAAADYFAGKGYRRIMALGGDGVTVPLADAGLELVPASGKRTADAVFVGWFRDFTMEHLEAACHAVWEGAPLFTASTAPFFATAHGRAIGTSRAICAVITSLTGKRPRVLGKPSLQALRCSARYLGVGLKSLAVVGDDPGLEVAMAHRGGALAVAVTSGLASHADFHDLPADRHPHIAVPGVAELLDLLRRERVGLARG